MPEIDGLDSCQKLQKMDELRATKKIFVSSHSDELWKERSAEAGADGNNTKPFDANTLVQTIESMARLEES
jgi:CheY-like chemotaxis protein